MNVEQRITRLSKLTLIDTIDTIDEILLIGLNKKIITISKCNISSEIFDWANENNVQFLHIMDNNGLPNRGLYVYFTVWFKRGTLTKSQIKKYVESQLYSNVPKSPPMNADWDYD